MHRILVALLFLSACQTTSTGPLEQAEDPLKAGKDRCVSEGGIVETRPFEVWENGVVVNRGVYYVCVKTVGTTQIITTIGGLPRP